MKTGIHVGNNVDAAAVQEIGAQLVAILETISDKRISDTVALRAIDALSTSAGVNNTTIQHSHIG